MIPNLTSDDHYARLSFPQLELWMLLIASTHHSMSLFRAFAQDSDNEILLDSAQPLYGHRFARGVKKDIEM